MKLSVAINRELILKTLSLMLVMALVCVINPEVRVVLLAIDSIGLDLFLLFLAFQGHEYRLLVARVVTLPIGRRLFAIAPYPMVWPTRGLFRDYPLWGAFATVQFMAIAGTIGIIASAFTSSAGEALHVLL